MSNKTLCMTDGFVGSPQWSAKFSADRLGKTFFVIKDGFALLFFNRKENILMICNAWRTFNHGLWQDEINVSDFILKNFTLYEGNDEFLCAPTERTEYVLNLAQELLRQEKENNGVLSVDVDKVSSLLSYKPAYLDKERDLIVGFQTEKPLERGINPFGGIKMVRGALESYGPTKSKKRSCTEQLTMTACSVCILLRCVRLGAAE